MSIERAMQELGYSTKEAKLYVAGLQSESTLSEMSRRAGIPRTTANDVLEVMKEKGLMHSYLKKKRVYWISENPERVLQRSSEKQEVFRSAISAAKLKNHGQKGTSIRIYEGKKELKWLFLGIIEEKRNINAVLNFKTLVDLLGNSTLQQLIKMRVSKHLRMRALTLREPISVNLKKKDEEHLRMTRFFPNEFLMSNAIYYFYGSKIAIIFNNTTPMALVIDDEDMSVAVNNLFELVWKLSSES